MSHPYLEGNALVCGDSLDIMCELPDECIDLVYLDPLFNSNNSYPPSFGNNGKRLRDVWRWGDDSQSAFDRLPQGSLRDCVRGVQLQTGEKSSMSAYVLYMGMRIKEMHRVLKPTGSIYLHCDVHANSYLRVLMDALFGMNRFRNEIVWGYAPSGAAPKYGFHRKHDTILYYSKGGNPYFQRQHTRMNARTLSTYKHVDDDGRKYAISHGGRRSYLDKQGGRPIPSWWVDIPSFGTATNAKERLGYPTQKPRALLERIIKSSSKSGDIVLDPFCGCGTSADAAATLERGYLGIDISSIAVCAMERRLRGRGYNPVVYGVECANEAE